MIDMKDKEIEINVPASSGNIGLYRSNDSIPYPFDVGAISITGSNAGNQYYYYYYDIEVMPYTYENIYICSSSIFPTSGSVNPNNTIVGLGLRLGDYLAKN